MFFSEFTRTKCTVPLLFLSLVFVSSLNEYLPLCTWLFSRSCMQSILGELLLWSLNYYSFVTELSCGHWTDCLFWTMRTKHIKQKNNNKNLFLEYLCFHLSVDNWRKSCSNWVHTWPGWRCKYILKSSSEKLILKCWVMVLLFLKGASHQV